MVSLRHITILSCFLLFTIAAAPQPPTPPEPPTNGDAAPDIRVLTEIDNMARNELTIWEQFMCGVCMMLCLGLVDDSYANQVPLGEFRNAFWGIFMQLVGSCFAMPAIAIVALEAEV
jgi:hypothetical protein